MKKRIIFKRSEILRRLKGNEAKGIPIIGAGCSCGLIAKCAEKGGADLIIVYSTGLSRLKGLPTTILGDSNAITICMADEILNVVSDTPIIGGIEAGDPRFWDLSYLIDKFMAAGFSGLINYPTIGFFESGTMWRNEYESVGMGFSREVEAIKIAHERDIFTIAYAFRPNEAVLMAEAGLDCVVAHVGCTTGGMVGSDAPPIEIAVKTVEDICSAAKKTSPDIICLAHGGSFAEPEDTEYLYKHTEVSGFVGASSIERIPVEKAIIETMHKFKSYKIKQFLH